jgi:hypothetical protein
MAVVKSWSVSTSERDSRVGLSSEGLAEMLSLCRSSARCMCGPRAASEVGTSQTTTTLDLERHLCLTLYVTIALTVRRLPAPSCLRSLSSSRKPTWLVSRMVLSWPSGSPSPCASSNVLRPLLTVRHPAQTTKLRDRLSSVMSAALSRTTAPFSLRAQSSLLPLRLSCCRRRYGHHVLGPTWDGLFSLLLVSVALDEGLASV